MKYGILAITILFMLTLLSAIYNRNKTTVDTQAKSNTSTLKTDKATITKLTDNGGRVAWYKGQNHNLIAYDAVVNKLNRNTELFTMDPLSKETACITCNSPIPKGFTGQADWHPGGEYLILQAENEFSEHGVFNHPAWGVDNDLWLIKKDGSEAVKLWDTPEGQAVLHPHFNEDGTKIMFAERIPTGKQVPGGKLLGTPGGENQWDGWQIHIADFNLAEKAFSNHTILFANSTGIYESHGFRGNQIIFTHTAGGRPYMDEIYMADMDGTNVRKLTNDGNTWDEHGHFSPANSTLLAYMSSSPFSEWRARSGGKAQNLKTELMLKDITSGKSTQLTEMNKTLGKDIVISDFDWNKDGTQIVFQVAEIKGGVNPELWLLTLNN